MSRLDDELRIAFRREPAPDGFLEKVLERASSQGAPQARQRGRWRHLLGDWFGFSSWSLAQAVTAGLLLIAIVALAFWMSQQRQLEPQSQQATKQEPTSEQPTIEQPSRPDQRASSGPPKQPSPPAPERQDPVRQSDRRKRLPQRGNEPSREAEAAREQVMLALQIASATLGEAQRSVQDGEDRPRSR